MNILYVIKALSVVEPLGAMQISAITRAHGHHSALAVIDHGDVFSAIESFRPDLVAYSMLSTEAGAFRRVTEQIKARYPKLPIIAGGPHPTYFPQMIDDWPLDAIVVGEGDAAIVEVVAAMEQGRDYSELANVHTRERKNPIGRLIDDLDTLPHPDRELVHHRIPLKYTPMKSFMATRGCPFSCSYCFNNAYKELYRGLGRMVRRRSVEHLIQEIEQVKACYPLKFVRFGDDVFVAKQDEWLEEFKEKYRARVNLPFYCLIRPNLVKEPIIRSLKEAGCHSVSMSLETGNEALRNEVLNRSINDEVLVRAYEIIHKYDLRIFSNAMLGLPTSSLEQDLETLDMTFRCHPTYASYTVFTPFPGTNLYKLCLDNGEIESLFEQGSFPESMFHGSVLKSVTPGERDIHQNILMLGALANWVPWLRGLIRQRLIFWKPNWLFAVVSFFVRNYLQRRIWSFRVGPVNFVRLVYAVYRLDRKNFGK